MRQLIWVVSETPGSSAHPGSPQLLPRLTQPPPGGGGLHLGPTEGSPAARAEHRKVGAVRTWTPQASHPGDTKQVPELTRGTQGKAHTWDKQFRPESHTAHTRDMHKSHPAHTQLTSGALSSHAAPAQWPFLGGDLRGWATVFIRGSGSP